MLSIRKLVFRFLGKICPKLGRVYESLKLVTCSLCYNSHVDSGYVVDTLLEPMFWFVDHFTQALGPVFVVMVIVMLAIFVIIAYAIGLPFWWQRSRLITFISLIIGNWLLVNVVFHYYMALTTSPGHPPEDEIITEAVSICKKCIAPKPPRTHHCSVCDRCILKMDHHCPWLNNCVGYFNHRYFFMFCFYTWLGCIFVMIFGASIALDHYYNEYIAVRDANSTQIEFVPLEQVTLGSSESLHSSSYFEKLSPSLRHGLIMFEALTTGGVFVAVGALMAWHAKLITKGETCVETHINKKESERLAKQCKTFKNPFDRGPRNNWRIFLGFNEYGVSWKHVLLPSKHKPLGDGLHWNLYYT